MADQDDNEPVQTHEETVEARRRVQLDFTPAGYERLVEIRGISGCTSNAQTILNALRLLEWFYGKRAEGYTICLAKGDKAIEVEILL